MFQKDKRFALPFINVSPVTGVVKSEQDLSLLVLEKVAMQGIGRIHLYLKSVEKLQQNDRRSQVPQQKGEEKPIDAIVTVLDNDMGTTIRLFEWLSRHRGKTLEEIYESDFSL